MRPTLGVIFFLSGAAALLFESLWFRQSLLAFGNSVWASSLVLSSFMGGVALGNGLAARLGPGIRRPIALYALLEGIVGVSGFALVAGLPELGTLLVPLFRPLLGLDVALQALRFVLAFLVLLGPAVAMGATLPLLVGALSRRRADFGSALGFLYGWNTLGAVCGALVGELYLIARIGVFGAAAVAVMLNVLAATGALALPHAYPELARPAGAAAEERGSRARIPRRGRRLLLASFLAGLTLLALEVVWVRLLVLFVGATATAFAVMLAIVLGGIGSGSLAAVAWLRRDPVADRRAGSVALGCGALAVAGYAGLGLPLPEEGGRFVLLSPTGLSLAVILTFPVSAASGALFPLLGKALNDALDGPVRSTGLLTFVNTLGAAGGPLLAGFVLLPLLGMERSIALLSASYLAVALSSSRLEDLRTARLSALTAVAFLVAVVAFPAGRLEAEYLGPVTRLRLWPGAEVVAQREGVAETIVISRLSFLGEPVGHQLLTNGHSMSASGPIGRRYMSLFAYLPAALHPGLRDALLISYGVGNTAKSLTRLEDIRAIDVVDISREILAMGSVVFEDPSENPLLDPRVEVHVEDGRFFLQTTAKRFDLITGEPPPPRFGKVTYLYTQEYFQLVQERLRPGGMVSYWLPVNQLSPPEAASIMGAFCAVFETCSVWNGGSLNWILLGVRGRLDPPNAASIERLWRGEAGAELRLVGVESPASLGALFVADGAQLRDFLDLAPPVRDAWPLRIHNRLTPTSTAYFARLQDVRAARERFVGSHWVRRTWPDALRRAALREFSTTSLLDRTVGLSARRRSERVPALREALEGTSHQTLPLLVLGEDPRRVEIAERWADAALRSEEVSLRLGFGALARRAWQEAGTYLEASGRSDALPQRLAIYAYCRAGDHARVDSLRRRVFASGGAPPRALPREAGVDGCWAAAWHPDWTRD